MWYSDSYRRHLCDMHIEDWSEEFLSAFSPEEYVRNLLSAKINTAMLYFQSHVGLCYYPTKVGVMHRAFRDDPEKMKRLTLLCRENGIRTVGYYSLIFNTREHDRHPDWRMIGADGKSVREKQSGDVDLPFAAPRGGRYGHLCPNNPDYREFVYRQIDEILDFFSPDGMFFDMPFWTGAIVCHCRFCREKNLKATGREINDTPKRDAILLRTKWMGEFVTSVTAHVKARAPEMPVEHNFAMAVGGPSSSGCGAEVAAASDYVGGDLYGDLYFQSFTCKFMRSLSRTQPFEYMFSRCKPALRVHTLTKSSDQMKTSIALTMAHHGATLVIDAIDPRGTMDSRFYRTLGEAFSSFMPYESALHGKPITEVGILTGLLSRHPISKKQVTSVTASVAAMKTFVRAHILCDAVGNRPLPDYPVVVAPLLSDAENLTEPLVDYVTGGGILYLSDAGNPELLRALTGNEVTGRAPYDPVYLAPTEAGAEVFGTFNADYPLPFEGTAPIVSPGKDVSVLATLTFPYTAPDDIRFASIHSNPPGIPTNHPAVTVNRLGKGFVIWSCVPIEAVDYEEYGDILLRLLSFCGKRERILRTDAPDNVEITLFRDGESLILHTVALDGGVRTHEVSPLCVSILSPLPLSVRHLPDGKAVPSGYKDGRITFNTSPLHIFDTFELLPE